MSMSVEYNIALKTILCVYEDINIQKLICTTFQNIRRAIYLSTHTLFVWSFLGEFSFRREKLLFFIFHN